MTVGPRFSVEEFDDVNGTTPWCVVDRAQVGSDGEPFIVGRYPTFGAAEQILAACEAVANAPCLCMSEPGEEAPA